MQADPFLRVEDRSVVRHLDRDGSDQHDREKQDQADNGADDVHQTLQKRVVKLRQRNMADIDRRKPAEIFHIWDRGDDPEIIRDKFGVHTGFLTGVDDRFQFVVLLQRKRDRDLVQYVEIQDILQI